MTEDRFVPIGTEITTGQEDKGYKDRQNTDSEQTVKRRTRRTKSVKFFLGEEERRERRERDKSTKDIDSSCDIYCHPLQYYYC